MMAADMQWEYEDEYDDSYDDLINYSADGVSEVEEAAGSRGAQAGSSRCVLRHRCFALRCAVTCLVCCLLLWTINHLVDGVSQQVEEAAGSSGAQGAGRRQQQVCCH